MYLTMYWTFSSPRATYDDLPAAIEKRYGGIVDTLSLDFTPGTSAATRRATI